MAKFVYDASAIDVHEGLDAVRASRQVYIGNPDSDGLLHILIEPLDNSIDECLQDAVKRKLIYIITMDDYLWIVDFGRGIPVERHAKSGKSTLTTILTTLSSGGKMRGKENAAYRRTRGVHGMGVAITNALSDELQVWTCRGNKWFTQQFSRGKIKSEVSKVSAPPKLPMPKNYQQPKDTGTIIRFKPDLSMFDRGAKLPRKTLRDRLDLTAYLHPDIKFVWVDRGDKVQEYHQPKGLAALVALQLDKHKSEPNGKLFEYHSESLDIALQWSDHIDEDVRSFVNGVPTNEHGTHVTGLNQAVVKAIAPHKGKRAEFRAEDLRVGLLGIINARVDKPRFGGQTKNKLVSVETTDEVRDELTAPLMKYFAANKAVAKEIVRRAIEERKAQAELKVNRATAAKLKATHKGKIMLPKKYTAALTNDPEKVELYLVEGDSAGGTAKQARFRDTQAVLPVFGKILNVIRAKPDSIAKNQPVLDVLQSIGYDPEGKKHKYRVGKVILLADADADGKHINLLMAGLLYKMLRPLIEAGRVYVVDAPLFTAQAGNKRYYAATRRDLEKQLPTNRGKINITRIKGWGELNADALRPAAFDPTTRKLIQIQPVKNKGMRRFINIMGEDTTFRKELLGVA